jgi:cytochrome b pre-mRNA-processing protein 3
VVFGKLFRRDRIDVPAQALYAAIVQQARMPAFYQEAEVPDTVDGRFEMISLHAFLVMRHLKGAGTEAQKLSQAVFDFMFADMDQSLREIGVGDLSVGKRVKEMAKVFYGRVVAYEAALNKNGEETLEAALRRDHYGTAENVSEAAVSLLADYVRRADAGLTEQGSSALQAGTVEFGELMVRT